MFNYNSIKNILFSKGEIKMIDKNENIFKFSEIYINEVQNKIIGSDAKLLFEDDSFKINPENNPRIYANSVSINSNETSVQKGVLTYCKFRKMTNVHHGNSEQKKLGTIVQKNDIL